MSKQHNRPKWYVYAHCGNKKIEFYAESTDEIMRELLKWIKREFPKEDWPSMLLWVEGLK